MNVPQILAVYDDVETRVLLSRYILEPGFRVQLASRCSKVRGAYRYQQYRSNCSLCDVTCRIEIRCSPRPADNEVEYPCKRRNLPHQISSRLKSSDMWRPTSVNAQRDVSAVRKVELDRGPAWRRS